MGARSERAWLGFLAAGLVWAGAYLALVVAILDLDRLKAFNDRFGHQGGDRPLKEATAARKSLLRTEDLVARYGGEEFCLLMARGTRRRCDRTVRSPTAVTPTASAVIKESRTLACGDHGGSVRLFLDHRTEWARSRSNAFPRHDHHE